MKKFAPSLTLMMFALIALLMSCKKESVQSENKNADSSFTFVYLTDIHLYPDKGAPEAFQQVIDTVNKMDPDFVMTGGDLIMDALGQRYENADSLYRLYNTYASQFKMPVYNTIGNHEVFGLYEASGVDTTHNFYNEKLYEARIGKKYYAFDHKGWRFMVLDAIGQTPGRKYIGYIDSMQVDWIKQELQQLNKSTPIALSVHIPFLTVLTELQEGALVPNGKGIIINNAKEVLELFQDHNLKLVLQGHLHYLEDIYVNGIHFITAGAVSGSWWNGPRMGVEEGFLKVEVQGEDFDWEYIDYGWDAMQ